VSDLEFLPTSLFRRIGCQGIDNHDIGNWLGRNAEMFQSTITLRRCADKAPGQVRVVRGAGKPPDSGRFN